MNCKKAFTLVPVAFNDGTAVPEAVIERFYDDIFIISGGWTEEGLVRGAYQMNDGSKKIEWMRKLCIVFESEDESEIKAVISKYCAIFGQECMYYEVGDSMVEFIEPSQDEPTQGN